MKTSASPETAQQGPETRVPRAAKEAAPGHAPPARGFPAGATAPARPGVLTAADVLRLQRTVGNAAVGQLLGRAGSSPAARAALQRKVGFEFETGVPVKAGGNSIIAKRETVYQATDWKITPDSGNIEFVTEPFEEQGNDGGEVARMLTAVKGISGFADSLLEAGTSGEEQIPLSTVPPGQAVAYKEQPVYVESQAVQGRITARPQVTGGVSLENIPALMQAAAAQELPIESQVNETDEFGASVPRDRTAAEKTPLGGDDYAANVKNIQSAVESARSYIDSLEVDEDAVTPEAMEKLRGMLVLIYHYLHSAATMSQNTNQAKYPFSFMSRMSFSAMLESLDEPVRKLVDSDRVLAAAGLEGDDPLYSRALVGNSDDQRKKAAALVDDVVSLGEFSDGYALVTRAVHALKWEISALKEMDDDERETLITEVVKTGGVPKNERGPTRKAWLDSMAPLDASFLEMMEQLGGVAEQADLLSKSSNSPMVSGFSYSSPAMGEHDALDPDHQGNENQLVQIELRSLPGSVPHQEWPALALTLFQMIRKVQAPK